MRDNPIHFFFQFMTGQIPDQMALGPFRWFTVALYWALLAAAFAIAVLNWRRDPLQRTGHHVSIFAVRLVAAGMWYLGTLWKLPLPVSDGFKYWLDQTVKFSSFQAHSDVMQIFASHIVVVQPLVYLTELFITASLMLGAMVRLSAVLAILFTLNLLIGLYNDPTEWAWTYLAIICAHAMFAITQAGRSLGLDNLIAQRQVPLLSDDRPLARVVRWAS